MRTFLLLVTVAACTESTEAPTVDLAVVSSGGAFEVATTDLGYTVTTTRVRAAAADLELTIEGEMHDDANFFHPGHSAGGDVTGTMPGPFVLDWDGTERALGTATLIVGDYQGANLSLRPADAADGLPAGDPLVGHSFHLTGVASKDGVDHPFDARLDLEEVTHLVGAVFVDTVTVDSTEILRLAFFPVDPTEHDTIYDGIDFALLAAPGDTVEIRPGSVTHNLLRRPVQTHDHYAIQF